jgi:TetR/AcrR family transcriptional regulator, cholesterol catabolism regulator
MEINKNTELVKKISDFFYRCGIKSVTMDDIARELCISKKTLYQYFKDKNDIIEQIMSLHIEMLQSDLCSLYNDSDNAINVLLVVSKYVSEQYKRLHPSVTYDLQKYYPAAWKRHTDYRKTHIVDNIKKNMEIGIQQGFYRNDLNLDIIARLYLSRIENLLHDESLLKDYNFEELFNTIFIYHIRGIANQQGLEYLEKKMKSKL